MFCRKFFIEKFHYTPADANTLNSILYFISGIASPISGLLIDKTGRNIFWIAISVVATAGAHALLAFTMLNPYIGMVRKQINVKCKNQRKMFQVTMGLAYSMLASGLWPLVSLIVPEHQLGTAYGV